MRRTIWILLLGVASLGQAQSRAKNVIIFLADAGGIPTLNAASLHGYNEPQKLYVQSWPNIALSDTSAANAWVTDSAAGMTAIVTGVKVNNGNVSQSGTTPLKTIFEYAEQKGLSTGAVTNMPIADATPAATYAHNLERNKWGDIFLEAFAPKFGDGPDVLIGAGRKQIYDQAAALGRNVDEIAKASKRTVYSSLEAIPAGEARPIAVLEAAPDVPGAVKRAVQSLSKNSKGYMLMVEWDAHTDNPRNGLNNVVNFDKLIRELMGTVNLRDTLVIFTADHSFEFQTTGGSRAKPILDGFDDWAKTHRANERIELAAVKVGHEHTGEEVLVAAQGPGSDQVKGFMPNTQIFQIMMKALGWKVEASR